MWKWILRGLYFALLLPAVSAVPCGATVFSEETIQYTPPKTSAEFSYNINLLNYPDGDYYVSVTATNVDGKMTTKTIPMTVCITSLQSFDAVGNRTVGGSIQGALALQARTIMMRGVEFFGDLEINADTDMRGGYNCGYKSVTGVTTINGSMLILNGTLTIDSVVIR